MALVPNFFLKSVLSIGEKASSGKIAWFGTGFIVGKPVSESDITLLLITNKHVLCGRQNVCVRLAKSDGSLITTDVSLEDAGVKCYSEHPDPNVDIAAVSLNADFFIENELETACFNIDSHAMDSSVFLARGGDAGSFVYMLGYPMGLVDMESNAPICRLGCVARIDEREIARTKNILIDIQNFPGNSGSPIVSKPEVLSIEGTLAIGESVLLGIVHSYIPYQERLINSQTGETVEIRSEISGLEKCNPVEFIREVIDLEVERITALLRKVGV